ncbi:MAG: ribonuclease III, partial [Bifidobacteriaceae bacterium]|nr:ribonuclease III [Bifidobacteriaceae bacterium]
AVYISHGLEDTRDVVLRLVGPTLERAAQLGAGLDWKTSLQELAASLGMAPVEYQADGTGPDHARVFEAQALVDGREWGRGRGTSKKLAEQRAAENAYRRLSASTAVGAEGAEEAAKPAREERPEPRDQRLG